MGRKQREAATGNQLLQLFAADVSGKKNVAQIQSAAQVFKPRPLGAVARDDHGNLRLADQRVENVVDAFFGRQAAEVEQVSLVARKLIVAGQVLEMRENCDALGGQTVINQFAANK